jgi:uncharacterized protein (TIGR03067 family)
MRSSLFLLLSFALTASWISAQDDRNKDDLKKLQGKWKPVTIIHDGEVSTPKKTSIWVFSGTKLIYPSFQTEDEIKLDASKNPKELDVRVIRKGEKTTEHKAIYSIEGDKLKVCVDIADKGRPTAFESKPNSGHRFMELQRIKE